MTVHAATAPSATRRASSSRNRPARSPESATAARTGSAALLPAEPKPSDAVLVEMGLPYWQPPPGACQAYLATYGATRANAQAAAGLLGLLARSLWHGLGHAWAML